jgi:hypothetical protein
MKSYASCRDVEPIVACYTFFAAQSILLPIRNMILACLSGGAGRIKILFCIAVLMQEGCAEAAFKG